MKWYEKRQTTPCARSYNGMNHSAHLLPLYKNLHTLTEQLVEKLWMQEPLLQYAIVLSQFGLFGACQKSV